MPILSLRGYAKHRGVTLRAVQKAVESGRIERTPKGIDSDKADRQWDARTSAAQQRAKATAKVKDAAAQEARDYREAERQEKWEKVHALRRQNRLADAEIVLLAPINAWVAGMIVKTRDELLRIGPELRDQLAQESDPIRIHEMLDNALLATLGNLAEYRPNA